MGRKKRDFTKECNEISEFVNFIKPQAEKENKEETPSIVPILHFETPVNNNEYQVKGNSVDDCIGKIEAAITDKVIININPADKEKIKEVLEDGKNNIDNFSMPEIKTPDYAVKESELKTLVDEYMKAKKMYLEEHYNTNPKVIIENINPEFKAEYATDGSMAIDLITREEIEIPCNHFFKQTENLIGLLFDKVKDIYTGNMKAMSSWETVEREIKLLNSQCNKYPQTMIPMNIKVKYPEGYGALLIPRGSTFKKYGLLQSNSIGLIDTDFCSEHWLPVINLTNKNITIPKGVRIAQLIFIKKEALEIVNGIVEQHDLHNGNGSTDK